MQEVGTIYIAAVVRDKQDPTRWPYVSTPLGPYAETETEALARGRTFLVEAYHAEDIRTIRFAPGDLHSPDTARQKIARIASAEHSQEMRARESERAEAALASVGPEHWGPGNAEPGEAVPPFAPSGLPGVTRFDVGTHDLDDVLRMLGVNPADV